MKNYILMFALLLQLKVLCCDVCNMYDYSGRQNQTYLGVFYRYRVMNGYSHMESSPHKFFVNEKNARVDHDITGTNFYQNKTKEDFQKYQIIDLRFNYALSNKINVGIIVPLLMNKAYYSELYFLTKPVADSTIQTKGIGDIILFSDYVLSVNKNKIRAFIKPGLAVKLPTGNNRIGQNNTLYPHEVQTGTGTLDVLFRLNANIRRKNIGVEWFSNYRINTASTYGYKFGNSLNLNMNPFYILEVTERLSLIPKTGLYAEISAKDRVGSTKTADTGGKTCYYNLGVDFMYGKVNIQTLFQKPFYDNLNGAQLTNAGRLVLGAVYNF